MGVRWWHSPMFLHPRASSAQLGLAAFWYRAQAAGNSHELQVRRLPAESRGDVGPAHSTVTCLLLHFGSISCACEIRRACTEGGHEQRGGMYRGGTWKRLSSEALSVRRRRSTTKESQNQCGLEGCALLPHAKDQTRPLSLPLPLLPIPQFHILIIQ
jgi:hypothetical protein